MSHPCHRFSDMLQNLHVLLTFEQGPQFLAPATRNAHLNLQKWSRNMWCFVTFWLWNMLRATTACTFSTSQLPKAAPSWCVLYIFTSKCASRHNGVHFFDIAASKHMFNSKCASRNKGVYFFDIATSKNAPRMVFCTFWLGNVLRATTACNFSSLIWPDGSTPAALASLLLDHPEPQIMGKAQCFATFLPFRTSASSFFWLSLLSSSLFYILFSSLWLFPSLLFICPYCRKFDF